MTKTFIYLDGETIKDNLKNQISANNNSLKLVENNLYLFEFDDVVFAHALLLMGQHPNRFGYDLSHYISSAVYFFKKLNTDGFIQLAIGSSDFKRRAAEDLGVSVSSLFMVQSFGLRWETIAQIPLNRKFSKYTPDFFGFDHNRNRFIYESKGTTHSEKIELTMDKALQQAKSYPESATNKIGIVSFFPSGKKTFPSFTFVADPPVSISNVFPPDEPHSIMMHYLKVLEYSGFEETRNAYEDLLKAKFKIDRSKEEEFALSYRDELDLEKLQKQVLTLYRAEVKNRSQYEWREYLFVGRLVKIDLEDVSLEIFMGVEIKTLETILSLNSAIPKFENLKEQREQERNNLFSDGTLFRIKVFTKR